MINYKYIVQKGDTLSEIAQKLTGSWKNYVMIAAINKIQNADKIYEGQELIIPIKHDSPLEFKKNTNRSTVDKTYQFFTPVPESSAISPIPISFPIWEYQGADPDRGVVPIQYTLPKSESETKTEIEESSNPFKWARSTLRSSEPAARKTSTKSYSNNESVWNDVWKQYGSKLGLKDDKAYIHLLGQLKHESGNFNHMEEIADGSAYEDRKDLGNTQKGDGKKYKGRGPIQVTGRNNYKKIYEEFFIPNGLGEYNIVENPELGSDPRIGSLMTIGWLYTNPKVIKALNNHDVKASTEAINGGLNGFSNRINIINGLLKEAGLA